MRRYCGDKNILNLELEAFLKQRGLPVDKNEQTRRDDHRRFDDDQYMDR